MWEVRVQHTGLNAYRVVRGVTQAEAELKANLQVAVWNERWAKTQAALRNRQDKLKKSWDKEENKRTALNRTTELEEQRAAIELILATGIQQQPLLWSSLKDKTAFTLSRPKDPPAQIKPNKPIHPTVPDPVEYAPRFSIIDRIFANRRAEKINRATFELDQARSKWIARCEERNESFQKELNASEAAFQVVLGQYKVKVNEWERAKEEYRYRQDAQHRQIDSLRDDYKAGESSAVEYFFAEVLNHSSYPEGFPQGSILFFNQSSGVLIVDFELPNQLAFPAIKEIKYIAAREQFQEVPVSDAWLKKTYDEVLYQIALRTLYELYSADESEVLKSIVFNGWVRSIDKATGVETHGCILSVQAEREEFLQINLSQVEPKACFRKLKGVASSKLTELTPVRPILSINKEDHRFVEGYAVADTLDDRTNLAAMDWLDFENLIRELFEKEFSKNGGEVKITQASRDGGVDAIAFDPDPIRGGKIVIQAKRYTNVVGVSAVRDLYGTVHNEGATKGILVTTATYGPDAYEFAKDKPLTLLSGSELLSLLATHGHRAKIDLQEAKAFFLSKQN
ncbi:MAG: restriction endonuclease [Terracidiphilus sp.]|jgi:restriction system protein